MVIRRFEDIDGWKVARKLTREVYGLSCSGSFACDFGLRDQIRKAAGSIMHNIAEGFDSGSNPEFVRFLRYAQRSATEVQSELYVALDQNYLTQERFDEVSEQIQHAKAKIGGLIAYLLKNLPS